MKYLKCILLLISSINFDLFAQINLNSDFDLPAENDSSRSIIILGDTQRTSFWEFWREKNEGIAKIVLNKIAEENPDFVIHLGDVVTNGASESSWADFEEDAENLLASSIPIFPILGNHDYWGSNDDALQNFFSQFPHLNNKMWYSIKYSSLGIILLNSNFDDLSEEERKKQQEWYIQMLQQLSSDSSITALIVACHHPPYSNSTVVAPDVMVRQNFVDPLRTFPGKPTLFFSGHCHSYEHFSFGDINYFVSGGGGGPRQKLETNPDEMEYFDEFKGEEIREFHFFELVVSKNSILINIHILDEKIGKWTIRNVETIKFADYLDSKRENFNKNN